MTQYDFDHGYTPEELPEFPQRSTHDLLIDIAQGLVELLAEVRHLRNALGTTARSSVELAENAKGAVQVTVKAYADGGVIDDACIESVAAFRTLKQEIERGQMEAWGQTLKALQNGNP